MEDRQQGSGRARVRWINPLTGLEDQRVPNANDEEALIRTARRVGPQGHARSDREAPTDLLQRGFAVLPRASSVVTAAESAHGMCSLA